MRRRSKQIFVAALLTMGLFWVFVLYTQLTLPNVDELKTKNPDSTAFMERYEGDMPLQYQWGSYSEISPYLKQAVVIAEDSAFFDHHGFDWQSIREAAQKNWSKKKLARGASTITQQLAKNLYLSPSKNPLRKIKETLITIALEQRLSKQRILEIYLNVVEWGEGIYGAEAAAQHYFKTKAANLGPSQAAWLAAILPNPRYYQKHQGSAYAQRKVGRILGLMGAKKEEPREVIIEEPPVDIFEEPPAEEIPEEF